MSGEPRVSVCLATYRRPDRLEALLNDLRCQTRPPDELVVVDNDAAGSAAQVVTRARLAAPYPVIYQIQPEKNISLTRNRTVELASGDWLAFIDDDERAPANWLQALLAACAAHDADGVLAPVVPLVPASAPSWIRRGNFYDWPRTQTGNVVPANHLRFGNLVLRAALLRTGEPPFDPAYGRTGGEDGDLLVRLARGGARLIWCDEAPVCEPVDASRLSLRWLLHRSLRGGQDYARHSLRGRYGHAGHAARLQLLLRSFGQAAAALLLALLTLPFGTHRCAHWLMKASANLGKLSAFLGWHYHEYA